MFSNRLFIIFLSEYQATSKQEKTHDCKKRGWELFNPTSMVAKNVETKEDPPKKGDRSFQNPKDPKHHVQKIKEQI